MAAATGVPVDRQTALTFKGVDTRKMKDPECSLSEAGVKPGTRMLLVGSTAAVQTAFEKEERRQQRRLQSRKQARQASRQRLQALPAVSVGPYCFQSLRPLPGFSSPQPTTAEAHQYLHQISTDHAILAIMAKRRWTVGVLSEFAPSLGWRYWQKQDGKERTYKLTNREKGKKGQRK